MGWERRAEKGYHPEFSGSSAWALRPLLREPDSIVKDRVIKRVEDNIKKFGVVKGTEKNKDLVGTEKKTKETMKSFQYIDVEEKRVVETFGKLKKLHFVEMCKITEKYVNTMYDTGRTKEEIELWVAQALVSCEREKAEHIKLRKDYDKWIGITFTPEEIEAEEKRWKEEKEIYGK